MIKKPIPIFFNLDGKQSVQSVSAVIHIEDNRTETLDLSLLQGGEHMAVPEASDVTARFVRVKDKILISDNVACAVQENGNIYIPIDNAAAHMLTGEIKIEVNIVSNKDVLTMQFPLIVRVNNSILEDAEVSPESEGTFPELLEETKRIAAQALKTVEGATEALGEIDSKISAIAPDEIVYDDIAYHDEDAPASTNHLLVFFGAASEPNISLNLPPLTSADFGTIFHFEIIFKQSDMLKVQLQETKPGGVIIYAEYAPIVLGETISFDYSMTSADITGFRMRMFENAGPQEVSVKITKDVSVDEYTYPKSTINQKMSQKADLSMFDTEAEYTERQGMTVDGWALTDFGVPKTGPKGSLILIADVEGGEKLKISARPAAPTYFYCYFFNEDIKFDSTKTNGGFTANYQISGLRNTEATAIENYENVLVTAPDNAKKVILCGSASFAPSVYAETKRLKRRWSGKKWCAVGGSFTEKNNTATKNYTDYIAEATGIKVINMGQSGSGYKQKENSGQAFYQRISDVPTNSDVVTICGSFNDAGYIYGDPLNQRTYAKSFDDPDEAAADAAIEATRIPWNQGRYIDKNGKIVETTNTSYAVTDAIPVTSNKYYRIKTRMKYNNAFFMFKDGNTAESNVVYIEKLNDTSNTGRIREYDNFIKAPNNANYLYVSTAVYGNYYETLIREDIIGTVDDGLVSGDVPNGQETENYTTTLCGCINSTINNLYKIMPTVNLGIISSIPWIQYNAFDSPSCILYIEALEAICKKRGIPFLNLFYESNLRPWNKEFIRQCYKHGKHDHPDEDAHKLFAPRIEAFLDELLLHAAQAADSSGSNDYTSNDYTELENKPSINNVTLSGNKSSGDLNLQSKLTAGNNITIDEDNVISAEGGGVTSYNDLTDKPQINGIELSGNKTLDDLGMQAKIDNSHKLSSELIDDTNNTNKFVTVQEKATWNGKENTSNKVTSISASSTNTEYPSAKCVYDAISASSGTVITSAAVNNNGTITFTDSDGNTFTTTGSNVIGADGFSPSATVQQTASGATITVTDKNGITTANITNGQDGNDYVLTAQDKDDIANIVLSELPTTQGVLYGNQSN